MLLLLAPVLAIALVGAAALALRVQHRGQRRLVGRVVDDSVRSGVPSILYFTGAACTICHTAQKPALQRLTERAGDVPVREVDVAEFPALARRYRVLSLPTTIVLRADNSVADVNVGFASTEILERQLAAAAGLGRLIAV